MECPKCDADIRADVSYCPECGLHVEKLRKIVARWYCPRCEIEVAEDEGRCQECGLNVAGLRHHFRRTRGDDAGGDSTETSTTERAPARESDTQTTRRDTGHDTNRQRSDDTQHEAQPAPRQRQDGVPDQRRQDAVPHQRGHDGDSHQQHQREAPEKHGQAADGVGHHQQASGGRTGAQQNRRGSHPRGQTRDGSVATEPHAQADGHGPAHSHSRNQPHRTQQRRQQRSELGLFEGISIPAGIGMGATAYVANLGVAVVLALGTFPGTYFQRVAYGPLTVGGWLLYGAHQVPLQAVSPTGASQTMPFLRRVLGAAGSARLPVPEPVYYLLPMVGLYLAGLVAVRWLSPGGRDCSLLGGASVGVLVAVGYLALAVVAGQVLFTRQMATFRATLGPAMGGTVLFMGVLYPVVVGGLGGVVGSR